MPHTIGKGTIVLHRNKSKLMRNFSIYSTKYCNLSVNSIEQSTSCFTNQIGKPKNSQASNAKTYAV